MGYIQQSNNKNINAYLTQKGKQKIITGETVDFQVKYFSLHDDDVNYKIASKMSGTDYNILKSGFVPDVTGVDNVCLSNISDATILKNTLVYDIVITEPPGPEPQPSTITIDGTCDLVFEDKFRIDVTKTGDFVGYTIEVKSETISFPNSTSTIAEAIVLNDLTETTTPELFNSVTTTGGVVGQKIIRLNSSCKRKVTYTENSGGQITVARGKDFFPRKADSFNFTVTIKDASGTVVQTKKFEDINCSKRIFSVNYVAPTRLNEFSLTPIYTPKLNIEQIASNDPTNVGGGLQLDNTCSKRYPTSESVGGFILYVADNGNRRRDLNITQQDLDNDYTGTTKAWNNGTQGYSIFFPQEYFWDFYDRPNPKPYPSDTTAIDINYVSGVGNALGPSFRLIFDERSYSQQGLSFINGILNENTYIVSKPNFIRIPLISSSTSSYGYYGDSDYLYSDYPSVFSPYYTNAEAFYNASVLYNKPWNDLHGSAEVFDDWVNGSVGFTACYFEFAPKGLGGGNGPPDGGLNDDVVRHLGTTTYLGRVNFSTQNQPLRNTYRTYETYIDTILSSLLYYEYGDGAGYGYNVTFEYNTTTATWSPIPGIPFGNFPPLCS